MKSGTGAPEAGLPRSVELVPAIWPLAAVLFMAPGLRRLPAVTYEAAALTRACEFPYERA